MCDQNALAMTDLATTGGSTALRAFSSYQDSKSRKKAAKLKAQQRAKKGEDEVRISGIKTGRLFSAQRAAFAANGLDIAGSVTVRDVLADTAEQGVDEARQIRDNAATDSAAFRAEAASESPFLAGASAAIEGVGTVASKWYAYRKVGTL